MDPHRLVGTAALDPQKSAGSVFQGAETAGTCLLISAHLKAQEQRSAAGGLFGDWEE